MIGDKPAWTIQVRVTVERSGVKVLGPGRVELLGLIDRHRSIAAAAKLMGMSYRRAWTLVRDMNRAAGEPLVEVTTGGTGGGGASVTTRGREAIALYEQAARRASGATAGLQLGTTSA